VSHDDDNLNYTGACLQLQFINEKKHVIALTDGGHSIRIWSTEGGIWDAAPEIPNSILVMNSLKTISATQMDIKYSTLQVIQDKRYVVGAMEKEVVKIVDVDFGLNSSSNNNELKLGWKPLNEEQINPSSTISNFLDNNNSTTSNNDATIDYGYGVSSMTYWGGFLVVGGADGRIRLYSNVDGKSEEENATFKAVDCDGLCPVQGIHPFGLVGGRDRDMMAMVTVGWERSVRIWVPSNEENGNEDDEEKIDGDPTEVGMADDVLLAQLNDESYIVDDDYYEDSAQHLLSNEFDDDDVNVDYDEEDDEVDNDDDDNNNFNLNLDSYEKFDDGEEKDHGELTARSINDVTEEMDRMLRNSEATDATTTATTTTTTKDWRKAMQEADKFLGT